jgi:Flp pilus assembly protein TadG
MPGRSTRRPCEPAQSLVEFAVALPFFLFLVLAIFDFSRMLFTFISLTNTAREVARVASISTSPDADVLGAFNNYALYLGAPDASDSVTFIVADQTCSYQEAQGTVTCTQGTKRTLTCTIAPLPLQVSTCNLPVSAPRSLAGAGYVEVTLTSRFVFSPFFDAMLARAQQLASASQPPFTLSTTVRAYME